MIGLGSVRLDYFFVGETDQSDEVGEGPLDERRLINWGSVVCGFLGVQLRTRWLQCVNPFS